MRSGRLSNSSGQIWRRSSQPDSTRRIVSRAAAPMKSDGVTQGRLASTSALLSSTKRSGPASKIGPPRNALSCAFQTSRTTRTDPSGRESFSLWASFSAPSRSGNASTSVQDALRCFLTNTSK